MWHNHCFAVGYENKSSLRPKSRLALCNNLCRNARVGYSGQGGTPSSSSVAVWCCCPGQRRNSDVAGCRPWRARNGSAFSAETLTDDQRDWNQKTGRAFRPVRFFVSRDVQNHWGARYGVTATHDSTNPKLSGVRTIFVLCCKLSGPRYLLGLPFTRALINVGGIYGCPRARHTGLCDVNPIDWHNSLVSKS